MDTALRWLTRGSVVIAALCFSGVAFTLAEQAYYNAAARAFSATVHVEPSATQPMERWDDAAVIESGAVDPPVDVTAPEASSYAPGLIGELAVPQLGLATAILEGGDATSLRRGAGHLPGTAMPGEAGNIVLAGHRDTVFKRLGDLRRGDRLRVTTTRGIFHYRVARTFRVRPTDTWVLSRSAAALTLITCYPFDWIGSAPERWIVQAERISELTRTAEAR